MGEGPDGKKQLGRILLQQKLVTSDELSSLLNEQSQHPGERLATTVARSGKLRAGELLRALSEQQGKPAIDLGQVTIPLEHLALVPVDVAREHLILPLLVKDDRLFLAMADPQNRRIIDEIEFVTGKTIQPYVALHGALLEVIEGAYAAAEAGEEAYVPSPAVGSVRPSDSGADASEESGPKSKLHMKPPSLPELSQPGWLAPDDLDGRSSLTPSSEAGLEDSLAGGSSSDAKVPIPDGPELDAAFDKISVPPPPMPPEDPGKRTVLVVDDSEDIRRLLVRVLVDKGYQVFESADGKDALDKVRDHNPDVLLLDANLPEVHGFDLCRRVKASRRFGHIPVIMVSAVYRGWRFAEDLKASYGVDHFLEKPFRIGDVLAAVRASLSNEPVEEPPEPEPTGEAGLALQQGIDAYSAGQLDEAVRHLQRGVSLDPLAFRLHYHLGLLYGKQENLFEAIQTLETAIDLRPRDFSTLKNLAVLYQRAGFRLKATEMWERAMGSAPDDDTKAHIKQHLMSLL